MHDIAFPARKTDGARRVDKELATVLEQMTSSGEPITVRAVVRRMSSLSQPSSITRDACRMSWIAAAEQERIRMLAEGSAALHEEPTTRGLANAIVPDIRYLLSFVCIARLGNVGYAARELQVSQPTLSRQMQTLEEAFATRLFIRHGRGVTLTQPGSRLLRRLDTALPLLTLPLHGDGRAEPETGLSSLRATETVSLGIIPGIGASIISRVIQQFRARWPNLKLNVEEAPSSILEERLVGQQLDLAVLQDPPCLEALDTEVILTDRFGLVASTRTLVGDNLSPIWLRDLVKLPLVLPPATNNIRRRLEKACFQHGLRLRPFVETDSLQVAEAIVRSGLAFTVLPSLMVHEVVERGNLIFREIEQPTVTTVHAVTANREGISLLVTELIAMVREAMISLVGTGEQVRAQVD
jgi:LysR family nitrogen assimilation transcriptional regulator